MTVPPLEPGVDSTPVGPFGATVAGVRALVPQADLRPAGVAPGPRDASIGVDQVTGWLLEVSGRVAMRCPRWVELSPVAPHELAAAPLDLFLAAARDAVHNGAASYLMAARHPELARPNETAYHAVLWARYETGVVELVDWLADQFPGTVDPDTGAAIIHGSPTGTFPPAAFPDGFRF